MRGAADIPSGVTSPMSTMTWSALASPQLPADHRDDAAREEASDESERAGKGSTDPLEVLTSEAVAMHLASASLLTARSDPPPHQLEADDNGHTRDDVHQRQSEAGCTVGIGHHRPGHREQR